MYMQFVVVCLCLIVLKILQVSIHAVQKCLSIFWLVPSRNLSLAAYLTDNSQMDILFFYCLTIECWTH